MDIRGGHAALAGCLPIIHLVRVVLVHLPQLTSSPHDVGAQPDRLGDVVHVVHEQALTQTDVDM